MSNQSLQPNLPQDQIRQTLLDKFEENKQIIRELNNEDLLDVFGSGTMRWNLLSGAALTIGIPTLISSMSKKTQPTSRDK